MEVFFQKKILGKEIEVYCGGEDVYSGKAVEAENGVLVLEVEQSFVYLNINRIQAFWLGESKPHLQPVK